MTWQRPPWEQEPERKRDPEVALTPEQAARLDPAALAALGFGSPSTLPSPSAGRRGCRLAIVLMGIGAFIAIAVLGAMLGQLRTRSAGTADARAKTRLTTVVTAAQGIAGATRSFIAADPVALRTVVGDATFVAADAASTSNAIVSVRHDPTIFIAAAMGAEGTCWFARASTEPTLPGINWNRTASPAPCVANAAPIDGWTVQPAP